jgi:hypothetical protein
MTDNGIYLVDKQTGAHRTIVEGKLAIPSDLAVVTEGGKDTVHVADVFSYRTVDGQTARWPTCCACTATPTPIRSASRWDRSIPC